MGNNRSRRYRIYISNRQCQSLDQHENKFAEGELFRGRSGLGGAQLILNILITLSEFAACKLFLMIRPTSHLALASELRHCITLQPESLPSKQTQSFSVLPIFYI